MSDMREVILSQPQQILHSLEVNKDVHIDGNFDGVILAGMGGSGHPGDLLNALSLTQVPLVVHRSYGLPATSFKKPLVIASSYSGNTEESLSAYRDARAAGYALLVNSAGGLLADLAREDGVPWVKIDFVGMQPRHTLFASFTGLAAALAQSGVARDISAELKGAAETLVGEIPSLEGAGKALAEKFKNTVPVCTASHALAFAAQNFKIQINENAKTPAFWNTFPELNHNEMVGMSHLSAGYPAKFHVLMIRDNDDHPRIKARMDVTKELYEQWGLGVSEFAVKGNNLAEKIFYAVVFGLWTTYYLALAYDTDPIPVAGVENFKQRLKEVAGNI